MANPDSWVRSAYTVFWSRPGSSSHEYQPLGATRRQRPRRLRAWLPLAAVLLVAVLGLSTLGLVHRPGRPLGVSREAGGRLALSQDNGQGEETGSEVKHSGSAGAGTEQDGEPQVKEKQDEKRPIEEGQDEPRPVVGDGSSSSSSSSSSTSPDGQPAVELSQHQRSAPEEVLVVLKPAGVGDGKLDASGNAAPTSGD